MAAPARPVNLEPEPIGSGLAPLLATQIAVFMQNGCFDDKILKKGVLALGKRVQPASFGTDIELDMIGIKLAEHFFC